MTTENNIPASLGDNEDANYELFLTQVQQTGLVWGLYGEDGWAICPSVEFEDTEVFPFWSDERYAAALCTEEWEAYAPKSISIDDFMTEWLPGIHEDNAMVGPNWDTEMSGLEVEPADLAAELSGPTEH
ncbi:MAG: DUF2750 domain-containing protein [Pseudohongiella sp.]|nr:DUF2750 domain-containing protein [Pseudohongiella sp.]MDO9518583.1 DUF2750 domain-containing protein [Pseudohongiella sp.]MDP2127199.1 DUF2750 domain-containing protein [Pseudohongiella sp.]